MSGDPTKAAAGLGVVQGALIGRGILACIMAVLTLVPTARKLIRSPLGN